MESVSSHNGKQNWKYGDDVVAEEIETQEQLAKLRVLQCRHGQGYSFSKPLGSKAIEGLLAVQCQW